MLKAVTFDLGDTLIDYGPMHYGPMMRYGARRAYEYLEALGGRAGPLPPFAEFSKCLYGIARRAWLRSKLYLQDRDLEPQIAAALGALGLTANEQERREVIRYFFAALQQMAHPMPGAAEVLEQLTARRLKLAIVSNTLLPAWLLDESLAATGLLERLPVRIYSCALGHKKPGRTIFRRALEGLGVSASQTLHVGDRYLTDIWGARRSGLRSCLKLGYRSLPLPPVRADYRIHQLSELLPIVDSLTD
jgi:HAD superfamily hydrolase (TIGR01509 family)